MKRSTMNHPSLVRFCTLHGCARVEGLRRIALRRFHQVIQGRSDSSIPGSAPCFEGRALVTRRAGGKGFHRPALSEIEREGRRAAKDAKFRAALIRKLCGSITVRTLASAQIDALGCAHRWERLNFIPLKLRGIKQARAHPSNAALIAIDTATAEAVGVKVCKRGRNWMVDGDWDTRTEHSPGETQWKNGRPRRYTRATNTTHVASFGVVIDKGAMLLARIGPRELRIPAPDGARWGVDANGIRLIAGPDDYHPEAADLIGADPAATCLGKLCEGREKRRAEAAKRQAEAAEMEGVWVCLRDSVRAGNCFAGSEAFARRMSLDPRSHVAARALFDLVKGGEDLRRVRLAISFAVRRHVREMAQGFSILEDHR